jgi:Cd2+-exporting ATPase
MRPETSRSITDNPVSATVAAHLTAQGIQPAFVQNVTSVIGCGVEGTCHRSAVKVDNLQWQSVEVCPDVQFFLSKGLSVFCLSRDSSLLGVFGLTDDPTPDAISTVSELHRRGTAVSLVSGDNEDAIEVIATKLRIPSENVRSRCSPVDKQDYIKTRMRSGGGGSEVVLFCGDGTNDVIALAEVDIGLHMNEGTADAVLVRPYLSGILVLIDLSKAAHYRIVFNFVWAFIYNVVAVLLTAGAFVDARIPPQYVGLGESCPIILVAVQLRRAKVG